MRKFIADIKESGTKPDYSEQLNNNIQITNEFSLKSTKFVKLKAYLPVNKHFNKISLFPLMS